MCALDIGIIVAAVLGQLAHIVKKRTEEGKSEISTFKRWILQRPFNTLAASVAAVVASSALSTPGADPVTGLAQAFITGFAADSLVNRPAPDRLSE